MVMLKRRQLKAFMLAGDISKAHRRVKVREQDWGYTACKLGPATAWLNAVGIYGIASASYWWTRLAALVLVRFTHYLVAAVYAFELLLCSDDFLLLIWDRLGFKMLTTLLMTWTALGNPVLVEQI